MIFSLSKLSKKNDNKEIFNTNHLNEKFNWSKIGRIEHLLQTLERPL